MEIVEEIKLKNNHILRIYYDSDPESPRFWDNLGTMLCVHSRYALGDDGKKGNLNSNLRCLQVMADDLNIDSIAADLDMYNEVYEDEERLEEWLSLKKDWVRLPLYLYDHSGITINTTGFSCNWDSGQVGYIYCSEETILKEYGNTNEDTLAKVRRVLESEVETYDEYLTGDVYGFRVFTTEKCDKDHEHEEEIDSCWGFFGSDWKTNGILDHIDSSLIPEEVMA